MAEYAAALNAMIARHGRASDPPISITWIPFRREVGEIIQLPEDGTSVLVTAAAMRHADDSFSDFYVDVAECSVKGNICGFSRDGQWISNVTAWAELPQPYRGAK